MKAVILAAGEGVRMRPFTLTKPKPLALVAGKPLIQHTIDVLPEKISEVIVVIGYLGEQIEEYFKINPPRMNVRFVWQKAKLGTAHALGLCREFLNEKEPFVVLFADDIHGARGVSELLNYDQAILVSKSENPERFGVVVSDDSGYIKTIIEKPPQPPTNLVSTGVLVLTSSIFDYKSTPHPSGEFYLTSVLDQYARDYPVRVVEATMWIPVGTMEDIAQAEKILSLIK